VHVPETNSCGIKRLSMLLLSFVTVGFPQIAHGIESWRPRPAVCYVSSRRPDLVGDSRRDLAGIETTPLKFPIIEPRLHETDIEDVALQTNRGLFSESLSPLRWPGLPVSPAVAEWISYFASGPGRSFLAKSIERSAPYIGMMEEVVRDEGLPPEVLALVYIESGFDLGAISRKRAVGPWQFMSRTARRFGLEVDKYLDERRDPELSTRAAVRYLKYLYGLFDSWPLATASYNSGEGRVLRAMSKQNTRDFWSLKLPRQTREFIPKVTAVLAILSDPERYGFSLPDRKPLEYDVVEVNGPVKLSAVASACGAPRPCLEALNPALVMGMTPPSSTAFRLRVPKGSAEVCQQELSRIRSHYVAGGETLSQIADRYDVSVTAIARANDIRDPNRIRQGVLLTIPPVVASSKAAGAVRVLASAISGAANDVVHYTVRPGDSLWRISSRFGTTVAQLAKWNMLRESDKIKPGQVLKIFLSEQRSG
jgi:membrane-bound lytic murein transglycosylase D